MPASSAASTTARVASRSMRMPKLLQPSPATETTRPEPPRRRYAMSAMRRIVGGRVDAAPPRRRLAPLGQCRTHSARRRPAAPADLSVRKSVAITSGTSPGHRRRSPPPAWRTAPPAPTPAARRARTGRRPPPPPPGGADRPAGQRRQEEIERRRAARSARPGRAPRPPSVRRSMAAATARHGSADPNGASVPAPTGTPAARSDPQRHRSGWSAASTSARYSSPRSATKPGWVTTVSPRSPKPADQLEGHDRPVLDPVARPRCRPPRTPPAPARAPRG